MVTGAGISAGDSLKMAEALESVLPDIPSFDAIEDKAPAFRDAVGEIIGRGILPGSSISPLEEFSGKRKALLRSRIAMLRAAGGFFLRYLGPRPEALT